MNWFVTKIVYRIICGDGAHAAQFDEQLRLIQATNALQAAHLAREMGVQEQVQFQNKKGEWVQWKFIDVCDVHPLHHLAHGAELYSRIEEKEDAGAYEEYINRKAQYLLSESTAPILQIA